MDRVSPAALLCLVAIMAGQRADGAPFTIISASRSVGATVQWNQSGGSGGTDFDIVGLTTELGPFIHDVSATATDDLQVLPTTLDAGASQGSSISPTQIFGVLSAEVGAVGQAAPDLVTTYFADSILFVEFQVTELTHVSYHARAQGGDVHDPEFEAAVYFRKVGGGFQRNVRNCCEINSIGTTLSPGIYRIQAAVDFRDDVPSGLYNRHDGVAFQLLLNPSRCAGDLNGDGRTNVFDFSAFFETFGSVFGGPNYNPLADLDYDNDVDLADYTKFMQSYGCDKPLP